MNGIAGAADGVRQPEVLTILTDTLRAGMVGMPGRIGLVIGVGVGLVLVGSMLWRRHQIQMMLRDVPAVGAGRQQGEYGLSTRRRPAPWSRAGGRADPNQRGQRTMGASRWLVLQGRMEGMIRRSPASWGDRDRPQVGQPAPDERGLGSGGQRRGAHARRTATPGQRGARTGPPRHRQGWQIEFRAPGEGSPRAHPATIDHMVGVIREAIGMETGTRAGTVVVAVAEKGGTGIIKLAPDVLLTAGQQRRVQAQLAGKGYGGRWRDDRTIMVRMPRITGPYGTSGMLWIPVMEQGGATVWWPLHALQHLVLAGESGGVIDGVLATVTSADCVSQPGIMVFDPQQEGRDITGALAPYLGQEDALARARMQQLRDGFREHGGGAARTETILIVIVPRGEDWSDLDPVLHDTGGLHVVLVVGSQEAIPQLRGVCHRTAVVEAPSVMYPGLPDAFRPATLAPGREGQALGWQPGESFVWRGTALPQQVTDGDDREAGTDRDEQTDEKGADACQDG